MNYVLEHLDDFEAFQAYQKARKGKEHAELGLKGGQPSCLFRGKLGAEGDYESIDGRAGARKKFGRDPVIYKPHVEQVGDHLQLL